MTIKDDALAFEAKLADFATKIDAVKAEVAAIVVNETNSAAITKAQADIAALEAELLPTPAPAA